MPKGVEVQIFFGGPQYPRVAQLAEAPALRAGCYEFKSRGADRTIACRLVCIYRTVYRAPRVQLLSDAASDAWLEENRVLAKAEWDKFNPSKH